MSKSDSKESEMEAAFAKAANRLETKLMLLEFLNNKQVTELAKVKSSLKVYAEAFPSLYLYDEELPINDEMLINFAERIHELPQQMSFASISSGKYNDHGSFAAYQMLISDRHAPVLVDRQAEQSGKKGAGLRPRNTPETNANGSRNNSAGLVRTNFSTRNAVDSTEVSSEFTSAAGTARSLALEVFSPKQKQQSPDNSPTRSQARSSKRSSNSEKDRDDFESKQKSKAPIERNNPRRPVVSESTQQSKHHEDPKRTNKLQKRSLSPVIESKVITKSKSASELRMQTREKSPNNNQNRIRKEEQKEFIGQEKKTEAELRAGRKNSNHSDQSERSERSLSQRKKTNEFHTPPSSRRQVALNQPSAIKQELPKKANFKASELKENAERFTRITKSLKEKQESVSPASSIEKKNTRTKTGSPSPPKAMKKKQPKAQTPLQISEKTNVVGPSETPSPSFGGGRKVTIAANETLGFEQDPIPYARIDNRPGNQFNMIKIEQPKLPIDFTEQRQHQLDPFGSFNQERKLADEKEEVIGNMDNLLAELMGDSLDKYREPMQYDSLFPDGKCPEDTFSKFLGDSFGDHYVQQEGAALSSSPFSPTNNSDADAQDNARMSKRKTGQRAKSENLQAPKHLDGKRKCFVFENVVKTVEPETQGQSEPNQPTGEENEAKPQIEEKKSEIESNHHIEVKNSINTVALPQDKPQIFLNGQHYEEKPSEATNDIAKQKSIQQENNVPDFLNSQSKNASNSTKEIYLSTQQDRSHDVDKQSENLIDRVFGNFTSQVVYPQTEPTEPLSHQYLESLGGAELKGLIESKGQLKKESIYHSEKVLSKRSSAGTIESNNQNLLEGIEQGKINKFFAEFGSNNMDNMKEPSLENIEIIPREKIELEVELPEPQENIPIPSQEESSPGKQFNENSKNLKSENLKTLQRHSISSSQLQIKSSNASVEANSIPLSDYTSQSKKTKTTKAKKKSKSVPKKDKSPEPSIQKSTPSKKSPTKTKSRTKSQAQTKKTSKKARSTSPNQMLSPKAWSIQHDSSSCIDMNHIISKEEEHLKVSSGIAPGGRVRPEIPILRTDKIKAQNSKSGPQASLSNQSPKGQGLTSEFSLGLLSHREEQFHRDGEEEKCTDIEKVEFPEMSHIENLESEEQSASWYEEISLGMQRNPFSVTGSETPTQELSNPKKLLNSEVMKEIEKGITIEVPAALSNMTDRSAACKSDILKGWNSNQMHTDSRLGSYDSLAIKKHSVDGNTLLEKKSNIENYRSLNRSQKSSFKPTEESRSRGLDQEWQDSSFENRAIEQQHEKEENKDVMEQEVEENLLKPTEESRSRGLDQEWQDSSFENRAIEQQHEKEENNEVVEQEAEENLLKPAEKSRDRGLEQEWQDSSSENRVVESLQVEENKEVAAKPEQEAEEKLIHLTPIKMDASKSDQASDASAEKTPERSRDTKSDGNISAADGEKQIPQFEKAKWTPSSSFEGLPRYSEVAEDSGKWNALSSVQDKSSDGDYDYKKFLDTIEQARQFLSNQGPKDLYFDKSAESLSVIQDNSAIEDNERVDLHITNKDAEKEVIAAEKPLNATNQLVKSSPAKVSISIQATVETVDKQVQTSPTESFTKASQTSLLSLPMKESTPKTMLLSPLRPQPEQTESKKSNPYSLENLLNRAKAKGVPNLVQSQLPKHSQTWGALRNLQQQADLPEKHEFTAPYFKQPEEGPKPLLRVNPSALHSIPLKPTDRHLTQTSELKSLSKPPLVDSKVSSTSSGETKKPVFVIGKRKTDQTKENNLTTTMTVNPTPEKSHRIFNPQETVTAKASEAREVSNQNKPLLEKQEIKDKSSRERTMALFRDFFKNEPTTKLKVERPVTLPDHFEDEQEKRPSKVIQLHKRDLTPEFESRQRFSAPKNKSFHS